VSPPPLTDDLEGEGGRGVAATVLQARSATPRRSSICGLAARNECQPPEHDDEHDDRCQHLFHLSVLVAPRLSAGLTYSCSQRREKEGRLGEVLGPLRALTEHQVTVAVLALHPRLVLVKGQVTLHPDVRKVVTRSPRTVRPGRALLTLALVADPAVSGLVGSDEDRTRAAHNAVIVERGLSHRNAAGRAGRRHLPQTQVVGSEPVSVAGSLGAATRAQPVRPVRETPCR
jgi:hypothetical protein